MQLAMMQFDPTVGDIEGNLGKAFRHLDEVHEKCDLAVFPEMYLTGYPPRDLLERPRFIEFCEKAISSLVRRSCEYNCGVLMGVPLHASGEKDALYNSAVLIDNGKIIAHVKKSLLPAYDVFDEARYFSASGKRETVLFRGRRLGITLCEDMWTDQKLWPENPYKIDPVAELIADGAEIFINLAASPFHAGKEEFRYLLAKGHAERAGGAFAFVNQVGGNDELVFDGNSIAIDSAGKVIASGGAFREDIVIADMGLAGDREFQVPKKISSIHSALILGLSDYMEKCGFEEAILGLSGGIDSAVCLALAAEAVGSSNITALFMPSEYSHPESETLARDVAGRLGVKFKVVPIGRIYESYRDVLDSELAFSGSDRIGVPLQNIQARIRGNILMAYSNKLGKLLISTGNKSELAVGYCTLYGDMAGGLALISDVPKTDVYELARHINRKQELIPRRIIERAPSAELAPNQKDQDALPEYHLLDEVLHCYLERHLSLEQIVSSGVDPVAAKWIIDAVNMNEYKRRQMPPGMKVTSKAFGMGRRIPIAAKL